MGRFGYSPPKGASAKKVPSFESPVEEFHYLVDQLEQSIAEARDKRVQKLLAPPKLLKSSPRAGLRSFFSRRANRSNISASQEQQQSTAEKLSEAPTSPAAADDQDDRTPTATSPCFSSSSPLDIKRKLRKGQPSEFISLAVEPTIEQLRRIAELVVTGENCTTSLQNKERAKFERFRDKWKNRDMLDDLQEGDDEDEDLDAIRNDPKTKDYMQLFDLFFERQVLDTIISLLTGAAFQLTTDEANEHAASHENPDSVLDAAKDEGTIENKKQHDGLESRPEGEVFGDDDQSPGDKGDQQQVVKACDAPSAAESDESAAPLHTASSDAMDDGQSAATDGDASTAKGVSAQTGKDGVSRVEGGSISHHRQSVNIDGGSMLMLPPVEIAKQGLQSVSILIQNVSRATSLFIVLSNNHINGLVNMPLDAYTTAQARDKGCKVTAESDPELSELTTHYVTFLKSLALRMNAETLQFFLKYPSDEDGGSLPSDDSDITSHVVDSEHPMEAVRVDFLLYERALEFCAGNQESFVRTTALNICLNTLRLASVVRSSENSELDSYDVSTKSPSGVLHDTKPLPFRERLAIALFTCIPSRVELLVSPICTKLAEKWSALDEQIREIDGHSQNLLSSFLDGRNEASSTETTQQIGKLEKMTRVFSQRAADLLDELHLLNDVFSVGLTVLNEQLIEMLFATFVYPLLLQPLRLLSQRLSMIDIGSSLTSMEVYPFDGSSGKLSSVTSDIMKGAGPAKTALVSLACMFYTVTNISFLKLVYAALLHPRSPDTSTLPTLRSSLEVLTMQGGKQVIRLDRQVDEDTSGKSTYAFGRNRVRNVSSRSLDRRKLGSETSVFVLAPALADVLESTDENTACSESNPYRLALSSFLDVPAAIADVGHLAVCALDATLSAMDTTLVSDTLFPLAGAWPIVERSDSIIHIIRLLTRAVISASKVNQSKNEWRLNYSEEAAHALLRCCWKNATALSTVCDTLECLVQQACTLVSSYSFDTQSAMGGSEIQMAGAPSINAPDYDEDMSAVMHYMVLVSVLRRLYLFSEGSKDETELYLPIACESDFESVGNRVGRYVIEAAPSENYSEKDEIQLARDGMLALLKCNALLTLTRKLKSSNGFQLDSSRLAGLLISADDRQVTLVDAAGMMSKQVFCPVVASVGQLLLAKTETDDLEEGSVVVLDNIPFLSCVCEVAAAFAGLFANGDVGVVAEGVAWQSLYLGFTASCMVVVHPRPDETDTTRGVIVSVCRLEHLSVRHDACPPDDGSLARRLLLTHSWHDKTPPLMFLYEIIPQDDVIGPLIRSKPFSSSLDVWFEDQNAADHALKVFSSRIFRAKAERGRRVTEGLLSTLCE